MPILVSRFQKRHGTLAFLESGMLRSWNQPSHRAALPAESDKSPYSASLNNAEETLPPGPLDFPSGAGVILGNLSVRSRGHGVADRWRKAPRLTAYASLRAMASASPGHASSTIFQSRRDTGLPP